MRSIAVVLWLTSAASCIAEDLTHLTPNTFVEIQYATLQPPDSDDKGLFARQGWNKIVYDPDGARVLFYDRWVDKKHGGQTIYGNCLFALDPAAATLTPVKIDHWSKRDTPTGGYRTFALPENDDEPTPCPRHVYHAFVHVPELKAVFLCNGANQSALRKDGTLVGHDLCDGAWRLDLATNRWTRLESKENPPNLLDDAMAWSPEIRSLVYAGHGRQLWILDVASNQWRKAKNSPSSRPAFGETIWHDAPRRRLLILGGGALDAWKKPPANEFRELHAFDPRTQTVKRLADAPTAMYATHFAHDTKRDLFFAIAVFRDKEQPSGMFCYDPAADTWSEVKPANEIPPHNNWFGWMQLCYDAKHDCLIGKVNERFFAYRHAPRD